MAQTNVYAGIIKMDKNSDGTLTVYGKATDDSLDIDQQICDAAWLDKAMPEWFMTGGNIREQHSNIAAGVAEEYERKGDGHYISALIVDPVSVKKVENRVLKGFSIGIKSPRVVRDTKAVNGRIVDGQIVEVSLVDRPANPNAKLVLAKSVESEENLVKVEEMVETPQIEKELVEETPSAPMGGDAKAVPSREEMVERYAAARKALDEVTRMCKECGYDDIEKQYGETAEEETAEGPAGSGAEHELEEAEGKSATHKCLECGCGQVSNNHGGGNVALPDGTTSHMTSAEIVTEKSLTEIVPPSHIETVGTPIEEDSDEELSAEKSLLANVNLEDIVEKAVKSAMASVEAQVAELKSAKEAVENKAAGLESELATAKSLAIGGGPKRTTMATGAKTTNEWRAKADLYLAKAAATTDNDLAKGYREMAKDFIAKAETEVKA